MRRVTPFLWAIAVIIGLGLGIIVGARVIAGVAEHEAKIMQTKLDDAIAERDEANVELAFWKTTLRGLAEGRQLVGLEHEIKED